MPAVNNGLKSVEHVTVRDWSPNVLPGSIGQTWIDRAHKRKWDSVGIASLSDWMEQIPNVGTSTVRVDRILNVAAFATYIPSQPNAIVQTLGYYDIADGGDATYYIDENDRSTPSDGGTVFIIQDGRRAKLLRRSPILDVRQFGAKHDGITDAAPAIQAAFNAAVDFSEVHISSGSWLIKSTLHASTQNLAITGEGFNTILVGDASLASAPVIEVSRSSGAEFTRTSRLEFFQIQLNSLSGIGVKGIALYQPTFRNIRVIGLNDPANSAVGLLIDGGSLFSGGIHITHCYFQLLKDQVVFANNSTDGDISDNYFIGGNIAGLVETGLRMTDGSCGSELRVISNNFEQIDIGCYISGYGTMAVGNRFEAVSTNEFYIADTAHHWSLVANSTADNGGVFRIRFPANRDGFEANVGTPLCLTKTQSGGGGNLHFMQGEAGSGQGVEFYNVFIGNTKLAEAKYYGPTAVNSFGQSTGVREFNLAGVASDIRIGTTANYPVTVVHNNLNVAQFDNTGAGGDTSMLLNIVGVGLRRIVVGAADSASPGYRTIKIAN